MRVLFWLCVFGVAYSYFVYPLVLLVLPRWRETSARGSAATPMVSVIITAYNEVGRIEQKILNTLALDYPRAQLEILVASDCSTDGTDDIVRKLDPQGVRLVRAEERRGKEYAQWLAVHAAKSDILVFSDVATTIP